jgi:hypothetical protein
MTFALTSRAPHAPDFEAEPLNVACLRNWERLSRTVTRTSGQTADDVINIVLSGTNAQVQAAFRAAGWVPADPLTKSTFLRMYKAWTSMRGYPTAPVSKMLYEGREPDIVYQKSLNTVARRHHIRIWRVPGRDLWVGAATHDISIGFEVQKFSLTHRIDPNLDVERAKVFTDLRGSGCLEEAGMVNATLADDPERSIETDGRMLRVVLKDCSGPSSTPSVLFARSKPGNAVSRLTRRFALETRHYIVRDNYIYWGYRAIRAGSSKVVAARRRSAAGDVQVASDGDAAKTTSARSPNGM